MHENVDIVYITVKNKKIKSFLWQKMTAKRMISLQFS